MSATSSDRLGAHPGGLPFAGGRSGLAAGLVVALLASLLLTAGGRPASAKVFVSQNQALAEAFPDATRVDRETHVLLGDQVERIRAITRDRNPPKVVVLHTAWAGDALLGFAHIDVHNVRTKPEAFLVVLTPEGVVRSVRVLAFHEPLDYLPTDSWYAQFEGKSVEDRLRVWRDVHGVVGATLSARAAADGVRRMLAYYEVLLKPEIAPLALAPPLVSEPASERVSDRDETREAGGLDASSLPEAATADGSSIRGD